MAGNRVTKGQLIVGQLKASGAISSTSGALAIGGAATIAGGIFGKGVVSASSSGGFSTSSVALKFARIPVSAATTGEVTTSHTFPANSVIEAVYLSISTQETSASTKAIDIGLLSGEPAGDADGFCIALSTASIGVMQPSLVGVALTRGALMREATSVASVIMAKNHIVTGTAAITLSYTPKSAHTELVADIIVKYLSIG